MLNVTNLIQDIEYSSFSGISLFVFQLPDKMISSLVKYYYSWKKTRTRTSVMDRQARKLLSKREKDER